MKIKEINEKKINWLMAKVKAFFHGLYWKKLILFG